MTRPILPPRYVNGSIAVLLACKEHRAEWFTYSVLRAFAWSEDSLVIDRATMAVLKNTFGIPKQTLYRHLNWLASPTIHAVLRYGSAGGHTQVDFALSNDIAWDSPINETVPNMRIAYSSSSSESLEDSNSIKTEEEHSPKNGTSPKIETEPNVFSVYQVNIGLLTPMIADALKDAEQTFTPEWVIAAIQEAVKSNARSWKYCEAILRRWSRDGFQSAKGQPKQGKTFAEQLAEA